MNHNYQHRVILLLLCLVLATPASANWMGAFELDHGATSYLGHSELARVVFDFEVTNANGARFVVDAYLNGAPVPGRIWGGSSTYPMGTLGTHGNFITFNSGTVEVDQYRVTMFDPVTADILLVMYLPVTYFFGPHAVNDIQLNYTSPSWIRNGDFLTADFSYQTNEAGGVRISARPYTDGALSAGYGASGIALSPVGMGTSSQSITFPSLEGDVDEIRIQMKTADLSTLLLEFFVPVDLHWGANSVTNITFDPPFPECLAWDQPVVVEFDYVTSDPGGCHVWAQGANAEQNIVGGQVYTGSPNEPTSGHLVREFRMLPDTGEGQFKFVRVLMNDSATTANLLEVFIPVDYPYGPNAIQNVKFSPAAPAVLDHDERVDITFDYVTNDPAGVRVYNHPYSYGGIVPPYAVSGSILYTGTGSATSYFTVLSGDHWVNNVRMFMTEPDAATFKMEYFVAGDFTYGGIGGLTPVPEIPAIAGPVLQQNYPNPFNPQTTIAFDLPRPVAVSLRVFDLSGHLVKVLLAGEALSEGPQEVTWDGRDSTGKRAASGTYFYRLESGKLSETRRMVLVK